MKTPYVQKISVESYSGYKGDQRPTVFSYKDRTLEIREVLSQWVEQKTQPEAGDRYFFYVMADDTKSYLIFFDSGKREWYLQESM